VLPYVTSIREIILINSFKRCIELIKVLSSGVATTPSFSPSLNKAFEIYDEKSCHTPSSSTTPSCRHKFVHIDKSVFFAALSMATHLFLSLFFISTFGKKQRNFSLSSQSSVFSQGTNNFLRAKKSLALNLH